MSLFDSAFKSFKRLLPAWSSVVQPPGSWRNPGRSGRFGSFFPLLQGGQAMACCGPCNRSSARDWEGRLSWKTWWVAPGWLGRIS